MASLPSPANNERIDTAGGQIYVKYWHIIEKRHQITAAEHLFTENFHRSELIRGATTSDIYLHLSKRDSNSLYLITFDEKHSDERRKYTIICQGCVSDGIHKF